MKKIFLLALLIIANQFLYAQSPNTISWQGVVTDNDGNALDGTYDLTVKLYDDATEGIALWTETHTAMDITDGLVNLTLGSVETLDLDFSEKYWLEITVDEGEPLSRLELTSVPYAMYAKNAPTTLEGTPLILKDSLGNVRMKFDPDAGSFEILANDTVWYSVVVNSPPTEYRYISDNEYAITEGNKTTYKHVSDEGNLTLLREEIVNGNETTTKYYNYSEQVSREIITNQKTLEDGSTEETKKEIKYNNDGNSIKEETKIIRTDGTEQITIDEKKEQDGTTTLIERRVNDKIKEDDGTITNKESKTEFNTDGSIKNKRALEVNDEQSYRKEETQYPSGAKSIDESRSDGPIDGETKWTDYNQNGVKVKEYIIKTIDQGQTREQTEKLYNDDGSFKNEKKHKFSNAIDEEGNDWNVHEETSTLADGTIIEEIFTQNVKDISLYKEEKFQNGIKTWEKTSNDVGVTIKEYNSEGDLIKEEFKSHAQNEDESSSEENITRDEDGDVIRRDKTEKHKYKSNNNNKKSTTTYTYKYLDGVLESENKRYESVYTPDGSKTIQEQQIEKINWNDIVERFKTVSIPADGSPVTEDVSETTYDENRVVQVRTNTKKENGEVVEKSVSKNKPGTNYATQREKTTYSTDEDGNKIEKTQYNNESGLPLLEKTTEIDMDKKEVSTKIEDSEGNTSEVVQNAEGIKVKGGEIAAQGAKKFLIDHPTDETKYLQHASIESNEVLNQYSGNVTTDDDGYATVTLPDYFDDINTDFRYVLTVVGTTFARAIVYSEISENEFEIKTDEPNIKVSWVVIAKRNDAYMQANPFEDEIDR